ncbi:AT-rich interactive domain-containing protein 5A [Lepisosteus oculatus]|uniref:AT-rich interactive domain-containing protein 5A n=1 Tax=Lepisosteus oculatus TaxID=7918 RepID=UPI0035F50BA8
MVSQPKGRPRKKPDPRDSSEADSSEESDRNLSQNTSEMEISDSTESGDDRIRASQSEVEEKNFLSNLYRFMKDRSTPIERIPHLGFKQINLWKIYKAVNKLGGYDSVTARRLWKNVYDELGGSPGSTSAATCTRRHYERLVLPFERHLRGEEDKPLPPAKPRKQYKTTKDAKSKKKNPNKVGEMGSGAELQEKREDGSHCEAGTCFHAPHRPTPSDNPKPDHPSQDGAKQDREPCLQKDQPAAPCLVSQPFKSLLSNLHSTGHGVISPLVKKKLMAQATESGNLNFTSRVAAAPAGSCSSPEEDSTGRPSVIHCAQVPGLQPPSRTRDSSEGSPEPPSSSTSPSACSATSEDCLSQPEDCGTPPEPERQAPPAYIGKFASTPFVNGVCKPLSCYPSMKDSAGYPWPPREHLQVSPLQTESAGSKGQRAELPWNPGRKEESGHPSVKTQHLSSSTSIAAGPKACWVPPMSSFTKVQPKSFHPSYKLPQALKRPAPEETAYGKKLQMVPPIPQGEPKDKNKPGLPKPLPTHSLVHPQASLSLSYLLPAYDRTRPPSAHQLKGLSLHPFFLHSLPAQLALPGSHAQADSMYRHLSPGAYPVPYESSPRPRHYPFPLWHPQAGYAIAGLHPLYPGTKL